MGARLRFTTETADGIAEALVIFVAVGTSSRLAREITCNLYSPFLEGRPLVPAGVANTRNVPLVETSAERAQIIKYAANTFLGGECSFVNEIAGICEQLGADRVASSTGSVWTFVPDEAIYRQGVGFGGLCLEKDLQALTSSAAIHGYQGTFLEATMRRNNGRINRVVDRAIARCGGTVSGKRVPALEIAFKPGASDMRTSLSVSIIDRLQNFGASLVMHDPAAMEETQVLLPGAKTDSAPYAAAQDADPVMLLTDWPEYLTLDGSQLRNPL